MPVDNYSKVEPCTDSLIRAGSENGRYGAESWGDDKHLL